MWSKIRVVFICKEEWTTMREREIIPGWVYSGWAFWSFRVCQEAIYLFFLMCERRAQSGGARPVCSFAHILRFDIELSMSKLSLLNSNFDSARRSWERACGIGKACASLSIRDGFGAERLIGEARALPLLVTGRSPVYSTPTGTRVIVRGSASGRE